MNLLNTNINKYLNTYEKIIFNESFSLRFFLVKALVMFFWVAPLTLLILYGDSLGIIGSYINTMSKLLIGEYGLRITIFVMMFYTLISYLQLIARRQVITDKRILIATGLINKKIRDIPLEKITDMIIEQSFIDNILYNAGSIIINTAGTNKYEACIKYIKDPYETKKLIDNQRELNKKIELK